jgi:hypothetical protein
MKKAIIFSGSCLIMLLAMFTSCNSQTSSSSEEQAAVQSNSKDTKTITVYYFHGDRRCTTCKAVGSVSQETVEDIFADNSMVVFKDINIEESENNELKDKFELSGSGLFIYDGETKVDLTAFAFQKAVNSPKELTEKIILTVNDML